MDPIIMSAIIGALGAISATIIGALITVKSGLLDKIPNIKIFRRIDPNSSSFFPNRKYFPPVEESIMRAKHEICLLSIHATNFIQYNRQIL